MSTEISAVQLLPQILLIYLFIFFLDWEILLIEYLEVQSIIVKSFTIESWPPCIGGLCIDLLH